MEQAAIAMALLCYDSNVVVAMGKTCCSIASKFAGPELCPFGVVNLADEVVCRAVCLIHATLVHIHVTCSS